MTDTDRIDLDELDSSDDAHDEADASRGDWFWQGEGDPEAEPDEPDYTPAEYSVSGLTEEERGETNDAVDGDVNGPVDSDNNGAVDGESADAPEATAEKDSDDHGAIPRVPRENEDSPVGVPVDSGGAGAGTSPSETARVAGGDTVATAGNTGENAAGDGVTAGDGAAGTPEGRNPDVGTNDARKAVAAGKAEAKGPHGGGTDDMTLAITYNAVTQLSDPQLTISKAREWADWVGIIGEVKAPVINQFQRDNAVDADFFNGTGTGPAERLGNIGETSMFYADRMVVVGTPDDEWIAEKAGWEFIPFATAAKKADWQRKE